MKPGDVTSSTFIDFGIENDEKDPKFDVGDHLRISEYKNIFAKSYASSRSEKFFVINKVKSIGPWTNIISDVSGEEIAGTFYVNKLQKP